MKFTVLEKNGKEKVIDFIPKHIINAGYTGRDQTAVQAHIDELKEKGIPAPDKTPVYFVKFGDRLTQEEKFEVLDETDHSGEAEFALFFDGDEIYVGVGSDHTDRKLESASVPKAKQVCPKPIGHDIWKYSDLKDHWDSIKLNSYQTVDGKEIPYQQGTLADILPVEHLLKELRERIGDVSHCVIYSGTVPVLNGFQYGENFRCEMIDETLNRSLSMNYNIHVITEEER